MSSDAGATIVLPPPAASPLSALVVSRHSMLAGVTPSLAVDIVRHEPVSPSIAFEGFINVTEPTADLRPRRV